MATKVLKAVNHWFNEWIFLAAWTGSKFNCGWAEDDPEGANDKE